MVPVLLAAGKVVAGMVVGEGIMVGVGLSVSGAVSEFAASAGCAVEVAIGACVDTCVGTVVAAGRPARVGRGLLSFQSNSGGWDQIPHGDGCRIGCRG